MPLPYLPVRVQVAIEPGLSECFECTIPDFSDQPDPAAATAVWLWRKWGDMLVSPGRPWPWPLQQYTVFYHLPYTGRLVFESQAGYASPAYWPRPVLQEVAV
jgi:hypothetical protein